MSRVKTGTLFEVEGVSLVEDDSGDARVEPVGAICSKPRTNGEGKVEYERNEKAKGINFRIPIDMHARLKRYCYNIDESRNTFILSLLSEEMKTA